MVFLYAFDLLQLDGRDLRREAIEVRKTALAKLIRGAGPGLQLSEYLDGHDGMIVFRPRNPQVSGRASPETVEGAGRAD